MNPFGRRSGGSGAIAIQVLGCILAILLLCLPAFSQANFGRILGTVTDTSGGVVANATVSIIDTERGVARTLTTDQAGEYNAPTLIPGNYTVRVEAHGFKKFERQNIFLGVGKEVQVDMIVQPGVQEQTVTVTESIPLVETTNATLGGTLNRDDIQDMPLNGRNYQMLLGLRPGVMVQPGGGPWTQATNNIRPDESAWMVDGVMNASFYDARPVVGASSFITDAATIMPIDAIQEFNLEENPKAEFGWKPGAVVNVGVRSGTNNLHGAAYAFGRLDSWDARNPFNPGLTNGTCVPNTDIPAVCDKAPTTLKQFGGVVGGPIKKDKLFFFGGYEGLRSFIGNSYSNTVPETASQPKKTSTKNCPHLFAASASNQGDCTHSMVDAIREDQSAGLPISQVSLNLLGCPSGALTATSTCTGGLIVNAPANTTSYLSPFPNTNTTDNGIGKLDYRINSKHMINGVLWIGKYYGVGEDRAMVNPIFENSAAIPNWTVVGNWVWTPTSLVVNEFRLGYTRSGQHFLSLDRNVFADGTGGVCTASGCGKGYPLNTGVTSVGGFPNLYIKGFLPGASIGSWRGRPQENGPNPFYDVSDSVSYLLGKHALKFGGEIAHIEADFNNHDTRGRFDFRGKVAFANSTPLEDFFAGELPPGGSFAPNALVGSAVRTATWMNYAGFVQDDWHVTPKLMVNLGLRYSYVSPMKETNNLLGNFDPTSPTGLVQQGQASVGDTIWKPYHKDFSPRLGFAWDISGKGTTVVRGGGSIIYSSYVAASFVQQAGQQNFRGGSLAAVPTGANLKVGGVTTPGTGTITLGTVFYNISPATWNSPAGGPGTFPSGVLSCADTRPCAIQAVDPNLRDPYITNWNLSVTHAFTNNLSLEVGYVGNHGSRLTGFRDLNEIPPSTVTPATPKGVRPFAAQFPYLSFINQYSNDSRSNYHSLQATLTERVTHGLSFTAGYTYGHGLDTNSLNRFAPLPQDSTNPGAEYASSDFDIRNRFTFTGSYEIPGIKGFGQLLEGWKINTIVSLQSPQPWQVFDPGTNATGSGDKSDRWNITGNPADFKSGSSSIPFCTGPAACSSTSGISGESIATPDAWSKCVAANSAYLGSLDPTFFDNMGQIATSANSAGCFVSQNGNSVLTPPITGHFGNMGRNIFRDNGFKNVDFSVFKNFTFKERFGAQFRVEFFNLFNHPIISNPYGSSNGGNSGNDLSTGSSFGCGCGTPDVVAGNPIVGSGSARAMQLGLKLTF